MRNIRFLLWLFLGLSAAFLMGEGFEELGDAVSGGLTDSIDRMVVDFVEQHRGVTLTGAMLALTFIGYPGSFLIALTIALVLWIRRRLAAAIMTMVVVIGAGVVSAALKAVYHRPRPDISQLVFESGYSFPSGHAIVTTAVFGFLAFLLSQRVRPYAWIPIWLGYGALVPAVGFSRVYLGVHWPTDVIAGTLAGAVWLIACIIACTILRGIGIRSNST